MPVVGLSESNVLFVGTSHVARQSIKEIKDSFFSFEPDVIAVELDNDRLFALLNKRSSSKNPLLIFRIGFFGYLFALIGGFAQKKLGKIVGVSPGADMLQAVKLARNNGLSLLLLDRPIAFTLNRLSRSLTFKELLRLFSDIFFAPFRRKQRLSFDLSRVPDDELISFLISQLKSRYPSFYRVLIDERNKFMARRLFSFLSAHPDKKVLVVVGAGHLDGLVKDFRSLFNKSSLDERRLVSSE